MKRWHLVVALVLVALGGFALVGHIDRVRLTAQAEAEAARMELQGWRAAKVKAEDDLAVVTSQAHHLEEEIAELAEALGRRPKVRETVRWRSKEIAVPGGLLEGMVWPEEDEPYEAAPELPGEPSEAPEIRFQVRGTEARVESRAGNLFAVGEVELWKTFPPPEALLGTAPWEATVTELSVDEPPKRKRGPYVLGVGLTTDGSWIAHAAGPIKGPWGWWAQGCGRDCPRAAGVQFRF